MTNNQLMVIPQLPAVRPETMDVAEFDPDIVIDGETLEEVNEEVAALELRYAADCERVTKVIDKLNKNNKPLIMEIERMNAELQAIIINMAESDDLEDKANAEDLQKLMDDNFEQDTDHETQDNEAAADQEAEHTRWSATHLRKKCRELYKAIARKTHPDKCRHLSEDIQQRRRVLFLKAKTLLEQLDYEGLEAVFIEILQKAPKPLNLMQRLLRARQKREVLWRKMEALRQSNEWKLYSLAFHHGDSVADEQYRLHLQQTLNGLRQMVAHAKGQSDSDSEQYTHWV